MIQKLGQGRDRRWRRISRRWATVYLPGAAFRELVMPFQAFTLPAPLQALDPAADREGCLPLGPTVGESGWKRAEECPF